ncbi:T9SS type A sorting domain-containing protein [Natronoflexus pectinivorans]|uniref:Putative secreted protein (Por secretion system target) n=1 Tax=Natronoflexus pectinivorans TaxID=682526 RepID=A0A4R2GL60_9BACT|nr:T9SS type A sorting domain-containing protein [Natronoflexus pectinivorans]TCO09712.1 putative secreted protein (Por secretion system target) [Natronoflexus pectinivorans]
MKKNYFFAVAIAMVSMYTTAQVNILSGSTMEADDENAWNFSTLNTDAGNTSDYVFGYTDEIPDGGEAGALKMTVTNTGGGVQLMVYQAVTVKPGVNYAIDFDIKSLDGTTLHQFWVETYVGLVEPAAGADYSGNETTYMLGGFKYQGWAGDCPTELNTSLLANESCISGDVTDGKDASSFSIDFISEETTVYVGLKVGSWDGGGTMSLVIDNFVMMELSASSLFSGQASPISKIDVWPNPVKDVLNLTSDIIINDVSIFNVMGQEMTAPRFNDSMIEVSSLGKGVYFVKVIDANGNAYVSKFTKE